MKTLRFKLIINTQKIVKKIKSLNLLIILIKNVRL